MGVEFLGSSGEQLLHQVVINNHAQETAGRHHRVNLAKASRSHALAEIVRHQLEILGHVGTKEVFRQLRIAQRAEKKQARQGGVFSRAVQQGLSDRGQHFAFITIRIKMLTQLAMAAGGLNPVRDNRPIKLFLGGEMAKNNSFIHARSPCDLLGSGSVETLFREEAHCGFNQLQAAIFGGETHVSNHLFYSGGRLREADFAEFTKLYPGAPPYREVVVGASRNQKKSDRRGSRPLSFAAFYLVRRSALLPVATAGLRWCHRDGRPENWLFRKHQVPRYFQRCW